MRRVLIREVPYVGLGPGNIVPGGSYGVGGGAPPPIGERDEATQSALRGHANRVGNWSTRHAA